MDPAYYPTIAADIAFFGGLVVQAVCFAKLCNHLEFNHGAVWEELGRPTALRFDRRSIFDGVKNTTSMFPFVFQRRYRGLNDLVLTRLGDITLIAQATMILGFIAWLFVPHYDLSGVTDSGQRWHTKF